MHLTKLVSGEISKRHSVREQNWFRDWLNELVISWFVVIGDDKHGLGEGEECDDENWQEDLDVDYNCNQHTDELTGLSENSQEIEELNPHEEARHWVHWSLESNESSFWVHIVPHNAGKGNREERNHIDVVPRVAEVLLEAC